MTFSKKESIAKMIKANIKDAIITTIELFWSSAHVGQVTL